MDKPSIRIYGRHEDGGFETLISFSADTFGGEIPSVGDTFTYERDPGQFIFFSVVRRIFIFKRFDDFGWGLFVEWMEADTDLKEFSTQWVRDTDTFDGPDDADRWGWRPGAKRSTSGP